MQSNTAQIVRPLSAKRRKVAPKPQPTQPNNSGPLVQQANKILSSYLTQIKQNQNDQKNLTIQPSFYRAPNQQNVVVNPGLKSRNGPNTSFIPKQWNTTNQQHLANLAASNASFQSSSSGINFNPSFNHK